MEAGVVQNVEGEDKRVMRLSSKQQRDGVGKCQRSSPSRSKRRGGRTCASSPHDPAVVGLNNLRTAEFVTTCRQLKADSVQYQEPSGYRHL
jgi:hypothetical protein